MEFYNIKRVRTLNNVIITDFHPCFWSKILSASVSLWFPNTRTAECFYCFQVFENPDETRSTSFWNSFSIETKIKE